LVKDHIKNPINQHKDSEATDAKITNLEVIVLWFSVGKKAKAEMKVIKNIIPDII